MNAYNEMIEKMSAFMEQQEPEKEIYAGSIEDVKKAISKNNEFIAVKEPAPYPTFWGIKIIEDKNLPDNIIEIRADGKVLTRMELGS